VESGIHSSGRLGSHSPVTAQSSSVAQMRVVAAMDKFRGTISATEAAAAVARAASARGDTCDQIPLADGGEGLLEVFGGPNRHTIVTGPLGDPLRAGWRIDKGRAIIEMAQASGLGVIGGAEHNDPIAASTTGVGELIEAALAAGASRIIVGLGGSATTDGGFGAVRALAGPGRLRGVELIVACDVSTTFCEAAEEFGPQKGATPAQVRLLRGRLERMAQMYLTDFGVDLRTVPGSGAAGGLAGGLHALGGVIVSGFDLVAEERDLESAIAGADLVITGEGFLDAHSTEGKVVGGVIDLAKRHGVRVAALVGGCEPDLEIGIPVYSLTALHGLSAAMTRTAELIELTAAQLLAVAAVSSAKDLPPLSLPNNTST
jgi:glycerate 2-kinase